MTQKSSCLDRKNGMSVNAAYNAHRNFPPYCWRVDGPVILVDGKCPECGWTDKELSGSIEWVGWKGCLKAMMSMATSATLWTEEQLQKSLGTHGYVVEYNDLRQELDDLTNKGAIRAVPASDFYRWLDKDAPTSE
jgi:hypothetical protein